MKKFMKILLLGLAAVALASCSNAEKRGSLDGNFSFRGVYDVAYTTVDGQRVRLRRDGGLSLVREREFAHIIRALETISFTFAGPRCTINYNGNLDSGSYTLSVSDLVMNFKAHKQLKVKYIGAPESIFIFDQGSIETLGINLGVTSEMRITDLEVWIDMQQN